MSMERQGDNLLGNSKVYPPQENFKASALISSREEYDSMWQRSCDKPEEFWAEQAKDLLSWERKWDKVVEGLPHNKFQWFSGAKINVSVNCLDRHLKNQASKTAIHWEGELGDTRSLTYEELHSKVCSFANVLVKQGVSSQDVVTIYMPMLPEIVIAMLACARIGAMHNVVFAGFSAKALSERINDSSSRLVITADGGNRGGKVLPLKPTVDEALKDCPLVSSVIVYKRSNNAISFDNKRDKWWHELTKEVAAKHNAEAFDSEHPLFLLYTSGSTGKPKGIMHTSAGYLLGATLSTRYVFDLKKEDVFWCTADAGWITGHSYVTYGPLSNGATILMYEGSPNIPDWGRFWQLIEKYRVSTFYTAPTAIRALAKEGNDLPKKYDLSSLRILGSVGEPINPSAWQWYYDSVGSGKCPIVDTWWQTETGSIMISPIPGAMQLKPGSATRPFLGIKAEVVDNDGKPVEEGETGNLVIKNPWPSMLRGVYNDDERYQNTYWSQFSDCYFTGDGAKKDKDGYFWILGRVDDVLNVSGHRLSTMEIESALVSHPGISEAAVVGRPDEIKGEAIVAFVTLNSSELKLSSSLERGIKEHVTKEIGSIAKPNEIIVQASLPKTRSGKIMRRLLRAMAKGEQNFGDLSTLEDRSAVGLEK